MDLVERPLFCSPLRWVIAFHLRAPSRWLSLLAMGRYKHVSALGFLPAPGNWLFYDVSFSRTLLGLLPGDEAGLSELSRLTDGATLVAMPAFHPLGEGVNFRIGFWCVPAVKHLLGLRCWALRPDALYRWCLRHGGAVISER